MSDPRTNKEWLFWGRSDPLFAVASQPGRHRHGANPWTLDEFIEVGRVYFADVWNQWQQFGVHGARCVEIGCGAGRITRQLVEHFDHVSGLDVSPDQLTHAARTLGPLAGRATLTVVSSPAIPLADGSADAVFSCEVFQHFDSEAPFAAYLREAFRALRPGGTMCFHVPVYGQTPPGFLGSPIRNTILRLMRLVGRRRMMIYRLFEQERVIELLETIGFANVEMRIFRAGDERPAYFFARKP
jgi:SAM-dependent methyltransferase